MPPLRRPKRACSDFPMTKQSSEQAHRSEEGEYEELTLELGRLQRLARSQGLPVVIVFEGWEAAGKGTAINALSLALDPRGFRVVSIRPAAEQTPYYPELSRFAVAMPEAGRITIFDRSWYAELWSARARRLLPKRESLERLERLQSFERTLCAGGVLLIKLFFVIDKKEQDKRFDRLRESAARFRIDPEDLHQNRHFSRWARLAEQMLLAPQPGLVPFVRCDARRRRVAKLAVLREVVGRLRERLKVTAEAEPAETSGAVEGGLEAPKARARGERLCSGKSRLAEVELSLCLSRELYERELPELQSELRLLEHRVYEERLPVCLVFEGWDAAGKGGSIRRLLAGLDPRGYDVHPIAAPTELERQHHYLWRFWTRLPKGGHIAVFDRSWYGRVLVERLEGFATEPEWRRAFEEINAFERSLCADGMVIQKFWFHIDQQTQLSRFSDRKANPEKSWKLTDEDWRNRERWAEYENAVSDMLELNHAPERPFVIVPANDKLYARIFVLKSVISAIRARL